MGRCLRHEPAIYDDGYWEKYARMADTSMGKALTQARVDLVARHYSGPLLDVGIGSGSFVLARPDTFGADVNPHAVRWLEERGLLQDPYRDSFRALSAWDVLEHVAQPAALVARAGEWFFTSMPIYRDAAHCRASRHYRPGEHLWYWTHDGLIRWFERQGFECVEHNTDETDLGREDIGSYAFRRTE